MHDVRRSSSGEAKRMSSTVAPSCSSTPSGSSRHHALGHAIERAATSFRDQPLNPDGLALHVANCFDHDGETEDIFPETLFMSHPWIMDSTELLALLINLFQETTDTLCKRRVCYAVSFWIRRFPFHFDGQKQLCQLVERLKNAAQDLGQECTEGLDLTTLPSYAWLRSMSVRNPVARQVSLSFDQWSPEDISTSLSHIDYKMLCRVPVAELKRYVKESSLSNTPILERSITVFNNLSNWVQCMVLSKTTPKERAEIITKFVNVGKHLRRLHNFNTLMAVIGGITHSNLCRLSKTHAALTPEIKKELSQLTQLLSVQSNFAQYRKALTETGNKFKIPIMGVHLKDLIVKCSCEQDLIAYNLNGCDFSKSRVTTRRKILKMAALLSYFLIFNNTPHNFPDANLDLINTLKVSLDIRYNEDDIYELSLRREPRTLLNFESSPKSVVFAEWASGVSQAPDPETVQKHVAAMVDAVFKHYDHDKDGYISQAEFRQIAGNFPFIEPFGTIDVDRDGQISKNELSAYFVKINQLSTALRRGFKHDFRETTFLTPTTCSHCSKLLWGFLRQGCKCKDCGLAVHRFCKDSAVAECRRRNSSSGLVEWFASPRGEPNGSFKKKFFLSYKKPMTQSRVRTVSSTATPHASPERQPKAECSRSIVTTIRTPRDRLLPSEYGKPRPQSASCFSDARSMSAEEDHSQLVSLAMEEVFEDECSSTYENG
ncbi:unnamed protein product, partial [Mesorhabditis belari]|uniref:Ras guanyl-releasing protein 3 n=1 Tax=Mesorhabditis belari TaxID=2138241 RepID=A0AAF3FS37_9BILA